MFKKILYFILLILIVSSSFFAVSYESTHKGLDDYAYCMAIGIDTSNTSKLKLSFQIPLNSSSSSDSSNSGSSQSSSSIVNSVECESIDSGINLMNTYITQQINLSHCKAIIISEEFAYNGVSDVISTLMNKVEISSECLVIICRGNADELLNKSVSLLETASARYYDASVKSSYSTGYVTKMTISDFFSSLKDDFVEASCGLTAVNSQNSQVTKTSSDSSTKDSSNKAGDSKTSDSGSHPENLGIAAFKSDKLVGELNGLESVCHLLATGKLQSYNLTIPNPHDNSKTLDLHITFRKKPKIKVDIVNGAPYINIDLELTARILSLDTDDYNSINSEELKLYEEACNYFLKQQMESYLYKTSKEFKSDIVGFGKYATCHFLTLDDWNSYNWLENYKNAYFNISVDTNIKSGYLLMNF